MFYSVNYNWFIINLVMISNVVVVVKFVFIFNLFVFDYYLYFDKNQIYLLIVVFEDNYILQFRLMLLNLDVFFYNIFLII